MAYVYILQSKKKNNYYIGSTINIENRLKKHNLGQVKSTKGLKPWVLRLVKEYKTISLAKKIEYRVKQLKRRDYLDKMINGQDIILRS